MALVPEGWETAVAPKALRTGVVTEDWSTACCSGEGTPEYGGIVLAERRNKRIKRALKRRIITYITFYRNNCYLIVESEHLPEGNSAL